MEVTRSRRAAAVASAVERHPWRWLAAFLLLFLAISIALDLRNRMWIDELYTLYTARQPTASQVIAAIAEGCDGAPPLYALIVHALGPVFGIAELGVRLPSTIGFCAMCAALFALLYRRIPALYAAAGMLLGANVLLYFSTEGRSYGLLLACVSGALLCWQAAAEGRNRRVAIPLAMLLLAAGIALHYYALFVLGSLAAGEAVRWRRTRSPDWPLWAALAASPLVLLLHLSLIEAGLQFTRYYWARASLLHSIPDFYRSYGAPLLPIFVIPAIAFALGIGPEARAEKPRMPTHEWAVFAVLSLMPIAIVVLALLAILGARTAIALATPPALREAEEIHRELRAAPAEPAPILVSNHHVYMELAYYAEPAIGRRIAYGVSPELNRRFLLAGDSRDWIAARLARLGYRIVPVRDTEDPHLFFVEAPATPQTGDWLRIPAVWGFVACPLVCLVLPKTHTGRNACATRPLSSN